ncbi:MAG: adenylate cyclase [Flavobacteriales bacterium]|nr:adenylate cyclase [Flavobacteriales bacterium]
MKSAQNQSIAIAVLPFKNRSSDQESEFFCDGITEEIINALSKIEQLKVTSRTSSFYFKDQNASLDEIAEKLGVDVVLEGSVRLAGDTIRIQAQLVDIEEDREFWSESWDRKMDNLFEVQDEIALLIADKLRENEGHMSFSDHLVEKRTDNLDAYEHYLKGRFFFTQWNAEASNKAIEHFQKAVDIDPQLIDAHLGLADSYSFMAVAGYAPREEAWMKAIQSIEVAKGINPDDEGLNYMLANQAFFTEADFGAAMNYALKSVKAEPSYPEAHRFLSFCYSLMGDFKKAKEHILFAKSIDPLNSETRFFEANYYYRSGEYDKSEKIINELLEENDKNLPALIVGIYLHIKAGRLKEARSTIDAVPEEMFTSDERLGLLAIIDQLDGETSSSAIKELEEHAKDLQAHHAHSYLFILNAIREDYDGAFEVLQQLFESNSSILLLGFSDPLAESIRKDSRFPQLNEKVYAIGAELPKESNKKKKEIDEDQVSAEAEQLINYLEDEQAYLNPGLSLRGLAEQINMHPNHLSWLLNEFIGKNFNEFINSKRIEYFKKAALEPNNSHISLLGLAFESGFNSKTVFNTAFKKEVGMTPGEYVKSQK